MLEVVLEAPKPNPEDAADVVAGLLKAPNPTEVPKPEV